MSFKAGYIAPPWPHTRGDSVSAMSIINRILANAHHGCGLHDQIYEYRALAALMSAKDNLSAGDADILCQFAAGQGFCLDDNTFNQSCQAYHALMDELRQEQQ